MEKIFSLLYLSPIRSKEFIAAIIWNGNWVILATRLLATRNQYSRVGGKDSNKDKRTTLRFNFCCWTRRFGSAKRPTKIPGQHDRNQNLRICSETNFKRDTDQASVTSLLPKYLIQSSFPTIFFATATFDFNSDRSGISQLQDNVHCIP